MRLPKKRAANLQYEYFGERLETLRCRERRTLQVALELVCELISKTLSVSCNGRYFVAAKHNGGRIYLEQDRDLAVLNIEMPREYGFTRIASDTPHIVSARAYNDRIPIFEELPLDHISLYPPEVAKMIDPTQRWVLACPVLSLDPITNRHSVIHPPHGVVVFYGTHLPASGMGASQIDESLKYSQKLAEQMSHTLNVLELIAMLGRREWI